MSGRISFGVDYLHMLMETNYRSTKQSEGTAALARMLLVLEWGLSVDEQDQANQEFWTQFNTESLEHFSVAVDRLTAHVKDIPDAKAKLLTDVIMITKLDLDYSDEEDRLIRALGNIFDFRPSEIEKLFDRAADVLNALSWFTKEVRL